MNLALFDFDGTITCKDSLPDFLRFSFTPKELIQGAMPLLCWLAGYKSGLVSADLVKEKVVARFFSGFSAIRMEELGRRYADASLPGILRKSAVRKIREHLEHGDRVAIVTASLAPYVKPFAADMDVMLLATELEIKTGHLTGKLSGRNCRGIEKVRRIKETFRLDEFTIIYAYGDSKGDREMLSLADFPFMRHFE